MRKYILGERSKESYGKWTRQILKTLFGRDLTITILRHLYISEKSLVTKGVEERALEGKRMGHSKEMQERYSWHRRVES